MPRKKKDNPYLGIRVKPSDKYKEEYRQTKMSPTVGTIVGESNDKTCYRVLWDGRTKIHSIWKQYVTIVQQHGEFV